MVPTIEAMVGELLANAIWQYVRLEDGPKGRVEDLAHNIATAEALSDSDRAEAAGELCSLLNAGGWLQDQGARCVR